MQTLFKTFGWFTVAGYFFVYCVTLSSVFLLVRAGVVQGPDPTDWVNGLWIKKAITQETIVLPAWSVQFATAWVLTKLTEPVRLVVTLALVPLAARRLPPGVLRLFGVKPDLLEAFRKAGAARTAAAAEKKAGTAAAAAAAKK
jgi:hypothetical protein